MFLLAAGEAQIDIICAIKTNIDPTPDGHFSEYGKLTNAKNCVMNSEYNPIWVDNHMVVIYNAMWKTLRVLHFGKMCLQATSLTFMLLINMGVRFQKAVLLTQ